MTSFVHIEYANQHPGVARIESAINAAEQMRKGFFGPASLATLLLSAMAAAVMVVAYQVMDSVMEGHLLVLWIGLWAAAFISLAFFTGVARRMATRISIGLDDWAKNLAKSRADERLWAMAKTDSRVMSDLQYAMSHNEQFAQRRS